MARVLMWIALLAIVYWLIKPRPRQGPTPGGAAPTGPRAASGPERMVDCAHCGLHLPASDAVQGTDGRAYCCAEHRTAGPRRDA